MHRSLYRCEAGDPNLFPTTPRFACILDFPPVAGCRKFLQTPRIMTTQSGKRIIIGLVIGLGILTGGTWLAGRCLEQSDVTCQGRTLQSWLDQLNAKDASASNQAAVVVNTAIVPQLTDQMFHDTNDSALRMALIEKLNGLPGFDIQYASARFRRASAATWLGQFGSTSQAAVPALLQALKDSDDTLRSKAVEALGRIHTDSQKVIPVLIASLNDPASDVRGEAAEALGGWGKESAAAVPRLIQLLDDRSDRDLMTSVRESLKQIDPAAAEKAGVK